MHIYIYIYTYIHTFPYGDLTECLRVQKRCSVSGVIMRGYVGLPGLSHVHGRERAHTMESWGTWVDM